jgi:glycosyltransferase involved in cell wall biosynthesis
LHQTLDNVAQQSGEGFEHLIIDGASTDDTTEIARAHSAVDDRVRVISEPDNGIYDAMNKAITLARGRHIHYLNAGDVYVSPTTLDWLAVRLESATVPWLRTPVQFVDQKGIPSRPVRPAALDVSKFVNGHQPVYHQGAIMSQDLLARFAGFHLEYSISADYDLMRRVLASGLRPQTAETILVYVDDAGVSTQKWPKALLDVHRSRSSAGGRLTRLRSLGITAVDMTTVATKRTAKRGAVTLLGDQRANELRTAVQRGSRLLDPP